MNRNMVTVKNEESFRQVISVNVALLKFSGIVRLDDETRCTIVFNYFLTVLAGGLLVGHTYIYVAEFVSKVAYIESAMQTLPIAIALLGSLVRFLILYGRRGTVQKILATLEDLWKILEPQKRHHVISYIRSAKNLTYLFLSQCLFSIMFYAITPLFVKPVDGNLNATRVLPYLFITKVDQSPYYEIVYFFQICSVFNIGLTYVGVEMFGPLLITIVSGHLKVIQEQLKSVISIEKMKTRESDDEAVKESGSKLRRSRYVESLSSELRSFINYHRTVLSICPDIERLTNSIFLTQLVGSTYTLSAVGFKVAGNDEDRYKYVAQISIGLVQLLVCNWPPDALSTESQAVANAAYSTPWYNWPTNLRKSICCVILRAQKPVHLTAGKFVYLSLETFARMVSAAMSFFTVLRSFG